MNRKALLALVIAGGLPVSGCGSTNPPMATEPAQSSVVPKATNNERAEEIGGPLENVGTITISDEEGRTFRDHFKIGPLVYPEEGTPPKEVLEACNTRYAAVIAKSVFARGDVSVDYAEGRFPEFMGIDSERLVASEGEELYAAAVAYQRDGEWICRQEEPVQWEIQPGEIQSFPIWFIGEDAMSENPPTGHPEALETWHFNFIGPVPPIQGMTEIRGPGAGVCSEYEYLFLYKGPNSCDGS